MDFCWVSDNVLALNLETIRTIALISITFLYFHLATLFSVWKTLPHTILIKIHTNMSEKELKGLEHMLCLEKP